MATPEERVQPQNLEAEQCLLGSILLDSAAMHEVDQKVDQASFYLKKHQTLFKVIQGLTDEARPVDAIILREELGRRGMLEEVGGPEYLLELVGKVPTSSNAEYYADIVREKALLRGYIGAASLIATCSTTLRANEVFPIDGLPATTISCASCIPLVMSSST